MMDRDTPPEVTSEDDAPFDEAPVPPQFPTPDTIIENFNITRNLSTIQVNDTILFKADDDDKGATPFIKILDSMIGKRGPFIPHFEAKWLVSDRSQLKHVIRETKIRARGLYNVLSAHSTVTVGQQSSEPHNLLNRLLHDSDISNFRSVTAFPSDVTDRYKCYGHFAPPASKGWSRGSLCTPLSKVPNDLNQFLSKLHLAHVEKTANGTSQNIGDLESQGFSVFSLDEFISLA